MNICMFSSCSDNLYSVFYTTFCIEIYVVAAFYNKVIIAIKTGEITVQVTRHTDSKFAFGWTSHNTSQDSLNLFRNKWHRLRPWLSHKTVTLDLTNCPLILIPNSFDGSVNCATEKSWL